MRRKLFRSRNYIYRLFSSVLTAYLAGGETKEGIE